MLNLIVAELQEAFPEIVLDDDLSYFAYHTGKAGGIAAAAGAVGVFTSSLCDDISGVYESIVAMQKDYLESWEDHEIDGKDDEDGEDDFDEAVFAIQNMDADFYYILSELTKVSDNEAQYDDDAAYARIGWTEYGAALNEAVKAREGGDGLRYALMIGFVSGLMFRNPGSEYDGRTILDAITEGYEIESNELLHCARQRIAGGVRMSDPTPFMGKEQYDLYMEERLQKLRWVQNFGLHNARAGDESMAVSNSMAINHGVRQMSSQHSPENPPLPIEMCYWVAPGKLLAGEYPRNVDEESSREKLAMLTDAGVSAFIDLTEAAEGLEPYCHMLDGPSHERFAIRDMSIPSSKELTTAALDAIDRHLAGGRTVYVHCWGGVGRTGTIIGCWLVRHGEPGQAALDGLGELWLENPKSRLGRRSPEKPEQERYVREWMETAVDK